MSKPDAAGSEQDAPSQSRPPNKSDGRWALLVSAAFFCVYALNVLSGKLSTATDVNIPINLGDVGEFLTLIAAAICFVIAALQREAAN
ncbi:hypothetical protein [Pelagibius sp. Alg239-R121]|uniref:hypothetical protein n=1 Tax=Pelagibius sp. Alg239-R121 TaxID=2993448 RepID=UPI0024A646CE|nr:hypothetical protein [Pelagibius sp. Alg239-R121]